MSVIFPYLVEIQSWVHFTSAQALLTPHSPPVRWPPWASIPLASSRGCVYPRYCPRCSYRQALCKRHRLVDHRASPSSEVLGVPGEDSAETLPFLQGRHTSWHLPTPPDTPNTLQATKDSPSLNETSFTIKRKSLIPWLSGFSVWVCLSKFQTSHLMDSFYFVSIIYKLQVAR